MKSRLLILPIVAAMLASLTPQPGASAKPPKHQNKAPIPEPGAGADVEPDDEPDDDDKPSDEDTDEDAREDADGEARPPEVDRTVYKASVRADDPTKGPADARVTIIEYLDFQCPFCAKSRATMRQIDAAYAGKVRRVFKHNPLTFHPGAKPAAIAAEAAREQGRFWEMADRLFAEPQSLVSKNFKKWAREIGCDGTTFDAALAKGKGKARVEADTAGALLVGAAGTPTFFVNGRRVVGAQPFDAFKAVIDEELAKAEALVASGTKPGALYEQIIANGKTIRPPSAVGDVAHRFDPAGSPTLGPANAPSAVVAFFDLQCPFCARAHRTLRELVKRMPGKVNVVFKHFPLSNDCNPDLRRDMHPAACIAAHWGLAAQDQGKFWAYVDKVYEDLGELMPRGGDAQTLKAGIEANVARLAKEAGVDVAKARTFIRSGKGAAKLKQDMAEARQAGVRGTPSLFVNGRAYLDAPVPEALEKAITRLGNTK